MQGPCLLFGSFAIWSRTYCLFSVSGRDQVVSLLIYSTNFFRRHATVASLWEIVKSINKFTHLIWILGVSVNSSWLITLWWVILQPWYSIRCLTCSSSEDAARRVTSVSYSNTKQETHSSVNTGFYQLDCVCSIWAQPLLHPSWGESMEQMGSGQLYLNWVSLQVLVHLEVAACVHQYMNSQSNRNHPRYASPKLCKLPPVFIQKQNHRKATDI